MAITNIQKQKWENLKSLVPTEKQIEIITGTLLGDGSLKMPLTTMRNSSLSENHSLNQACYIDFKASELGEFINRTGNTIKKFTNSFNDSRKKKQVDREVKYYQTISHSFFTKLEKNWYKRDENGNYIFNKKGEKIKIVPLDLVLTPLTIAIWYLDDGWHDPKRRRATLCTDGFNIQEVEFLCLKLQKMNIKCNISFHCNKPQIRISCYSYKNFIDMISPYVIIDCMKYKIDLTLYKPAKRISQKMIDEISKLKEQKLPRKEIAVLLSINLHTLDGIIGRLKKENYNV
jgi:hypothetical protein